MIARLWDEIPSFADQSFLRRQSWGAVNSINWARVIYWLRLFIYFSVALSVGAASS